MLFSTLILAKVAGSICKAEANSSPHCGHVNDSVLSIGSSSAADARRQILQKPRSMTAVKEREDPRQGIVGSPLSVVTRFATQIP